MPQEITLNYELTGLARVRVYIDTEMAEALGITVEQLIEAIGKGWVSYHAHPVANPLGVYLFNQLAYDANIRTWWCHTHGGHVWLDEGPYTLPDERIQKHKHQCLHCGRWQYD